MIAELTPRQRDLVRHALGLTRRKRSYRNHYVTERPLGGIHACDTSDWHAMVAIGAAVRRPYGFADMERFHVALSAARRVLEADESLDLEDFPSWLR